MGYPPEKLWEPLKEVAGNVAPSAQPKLDRYRLQRKTIITLRGMARNNAPFRKVLEKVRLATDVLLRE